MIIVTAGLRPLCYNGRKRDDKKEDANVGFFDRFKKQDRPAAGLEELQQRGDWVGLARTYFAKGKECLAEGDRARARLWLGRAQTICDSDDEIYEKVGDKLIDECSDLLGELEDAPLPENRVALRVEEEAGALDEAQRAMWGFLTLCRMEKLLERLGTLPSCSQLRNTGEIVDVLLAVFTTGADAASVGKLKAYNDFLYDVGDSAAFRDLRQAVDVPGGAAFQLFDLNGDLALTDLNLYIDYVIHGPLGGEGAELAVDELSGMVGSALLSDYWLRTQDGPLDDVPQVKAEEARIWEDLEFIRSHPGLEAFAARAAEYRKLDLLA